MRDQYQVAELLSRLKKLGIRLQIDGDKLKIDAPKGAFSPSLREELSRQKFQVLEYFANQEGRASRQGETNLLELPRVVTIPREGPLPLSFSQERLWFLYQLEPESTAYSMPGSIHLKGRLDKRALERAFVKLAQRHETLRTTFRLVDDRPEQVIAAEPTISLEEVDLRGLPAAARGKEAVRLAEEESQKPFDLGTGPLFRVSLYQLDDEDHMLHVNMHHTISDYWSFGIMNREVIELYKAFAAGTTPRLAVLPVQYADFAYCQRQWLQGEVLATQLAYWKEKLGGELSTLDIPIDRARPEVQTHRGAIHSADISKTLVEGLRMLSRGKGVSLFMVLLAAFKVLLCRYTGQEDIVVGTPITGRNQMELESLIGFFINTLAMRTDLTGNSTFDEVLGRVRETALGAYAHQEMPFEKLVEELAPERNLGRTPLFQVFFNHIRVDEGRVELPGLEIEVVGGLDREAKFDMTLYVWEQADAIRLTALYNADLFDADRIAAMLQQYEGLLRQVAENPGEKITQYSLVSGGEERKFPDPCMGITPAWAGAVHERFSEQACHVPENTAIVDAWGSWSYGEVERYGNQLAGYLLLKGIQPADVIAVYGHRSAGLVLALLGILKAGAAFLILDPRYPALRLLKMLEEVSPRAWLQMEAAGSVAGELNAWLDASEVTCRLRIPGSKEGVEDLLAGMPCEVPERRVAPDDMAYVIFTSGTTGQPKGIIGTHRPLSHFLAWHCEEFELKGSDRFSMLSGLSHDPLLRDIFVPLWLGATLCIPDPDEMLIPDKLRTWMRMQQITVADMTPALGQLLCETGGRAQAGSEELSALRHVFFGGDVLTRRHVEGICRIAPEAICVNYYGTTETPQGMGYHVVGVGGGDQLRERIPLGKGIEGVQLLVLNRAGKLAGIGELGEIYVRTPYLTKGYFEDETLTGERFITNPFSNVSEDRLYRTGDLGRYLPDGEVMFHGRSDSQVSIRGFRVELKEIESILRRHADIRDCAVIARDREPGDRYLTAYVVGNDSRNLDLVQLRQHVGRHLPEYMIPSAFVQLEKIPLTPNGKIDVAQLVRLEPQQGEKKRVPDEPMTETEQILVSIWKKALELDRVSVHDNFFEIGGHSLLSIRVISRLEQEIGLRINPREFIYQTLGQLAASIDRQRKDAARAGKSVRKKSLWHSIKQGMLLKRY
jgi:amino acid adenylation domain-containing protein